MKNKRKKRCSTAFIIKDLQIKTRCHLDTYYWLKSKALRKTNAGNHVEQREFSFITDMNAE